jgi:hypothetical protein
MMSARSARLFSRPSLVRAPGLLAAAPVCRAVARPLTQRGMSICFVARPIARNTQASRRSAPRRAFATDKAEGKSGANRLREWLTGSRAEKLPGSAETAVTRVQDAYSDIDIARSLPTYGPAATAGYAPTTAGPHIWPLSTQ